MMQSRNRSAYLSAAAAILCWSTVSTAFKLTLSSLSPIEMVVYASLISVFVLAIILLIQGKLVIACATGKKQWLVSAGLGFLNPFGYYLVLFEAYDRLLAQEAQVLNYSWAVVLVILSVPLLGQSFKLRDLVSVLVSFAGVAVIALRGGDFQFASPLGVGLALGSSILWALYWIYSLRSGEEAVPVLFRNFLWGTLYGLLYGFIRGLLHIPDLYGILGAVWIGCFEMGFTFVFWMRALKLADTTARVANLIYITPFLSLVVIRLVLDEEILFSTVYGLVLIIGGILLQRIRRRKAVEELPD